MSNTNFKITTLTIEREDAVIDISRGFVSLDYYEDVTSPTVIFDLVVVDGDGVLADFQILGGELVSLEIEATHERLETVSFTTEDDNPLCVVNASILPTQSSNTYVLKLMSAEILANETTRVVQRYDANISQVVAKLLRDDNELIGTNKQCFIEQTNNSYSFIGCFKRPFDIISWLCPKSVSSLSSSGFLFYETRRGYRFESIDKKFERDASIQLVQSTTPLSPSSPDYYRTFSKITSTESHDVLKSLRLGSYAHTSIFLDLWTMDYDVLVTKLSENDNLELSNPSSQPFRLNGLEDHSSRLMYRLKDPGVMDKDGERVEDTQLAKDQANAYMRYNMLFTSTTNISLPLNLSLSAGDVVSLQVAKGQSGTPTSKVDENLEDQRYIISRIRHSVQGDNNFSSLELISDSYSVSST